MKPPTPQKECDQRLLFVKNSLMSLPLAPFKPRFLPSSLLPSLPSSPDSLSALTPPLIRGSGCTVYLCGARLKTSPLIDIPVTLSNNGASNFLEIDVCPPQVKTRLLAFPHPWMTYACALSVCVCLRVRSGGSVRNFMSGLWLPIGGLHVFIRRKHGSLPPLL